MNGKDIQVNKTFRITSGEIFLTTLEYEEQYKVSRSTQCRNRKNGSGPPFVVHNDRILYPESGILAWLNARLVNSTAELSSSKKAGRYAHLAAAREKARAIRLSRSEREDDDNSPPDETAAGQVNV